MSLPRGCRISALVRKHAQKSRFDETLGLDLRGLLLVAALDHRLNVQSNFSSAFLGIDQSMKPVQLWS